MKQLMIIATMLLMMGQTMAQNIIDRHFKQIREHQDAININISAKAFELATYFDFEGADPELKEFRDFLTTVRSFEAAVRESMPNNVQAWHSALRKVSATHDEVMRIEENGEEFVFLVDENRGVVEELVVVGHEEENLIILSLTGAMDMDQLIRMSRWIETDEESNMQRLFENGVHEVNVFPNPLQSGQGLRVEVPQGLEDGTVSLLNMDGQLVKDFRLNGNSQKLSTQGLSTGSYILLFKKEGLSIRKKVLIH